jgi:hypothetical protein
MLPNDKYIFLFLMYNTQVSVLEGEQRDDGHSGSEPDEDARTSTVHISDRSESPASCGMNGGPDDRPTSPSPSGLVYCYVFTLYFVFFFNLFLFFLLNMRV